MKRKPVLAFIAAVTAIILIAAPVLAATIGTITAYNNSTTTYTNLPIRVDVNNNALVTAGTMTADGLNTVVQSGGVNIPTMIADNATYFVTNISGLEGKSFNLVNGQNLTNHSIITGNNGHILVPDSPALEFGGNYTVSVIANPTIPAVFLNKNNAFTFNTTGLLVTAQIATNTTTNISPDGAGASTAFPTLVGAPTHWQACLTNDGDTTYIAQIGGGTPTDLFSAGNISGNATGIASVSVSFVAKSTPAASSGYAVIRVGTNTTTGSIQTIAAGYTTYSQTWLTSPNTGQAWTLDEVQNMEIGVKVSVGTDTAYVTQVYATINYNDPITLTSSTSGNHTYTSGLATNNFSISVDGVTVNSTITTKSILNNSNNYTLLSGIASALNVTLSINGTQVLWYSPVALISGDVLPDRAGGDNPGTIVWGNFPVTGNISFVPSTNLALAPAYTIGAGPGFLGSNLTMSGNFTANTTHQTGGVPGATFIEDVAQAGGSPPVLLYGVLASMFIVLFGLFLSWMERKFGSTAEISLIRITLGAVVLGIMIAFGKFDWWMLFFYLVITFSVYLFRPPEGSVEQLNLIGFLATSWVGLTLINRMMAAQFITSTETIFLNNFTFTRSYNIQNIVSIPILNLDFVNGLVHLFKWDYSFFGGNAQIIQYFLYSFTLVGSFVIFGMLIYAISGLFLRR